MFKDFQGIVNHKKLLSDTKSWKNIIIVHFFVRYDILEKILSWKIFVKHQVLGKNIIILEKILSNTRSWEKHYLGKKFCQTPGPGKNILSWKKMFVKHQVVEKNIIILEKNLSDTKFLEI